MENTVSAEAEEVVEALTEGTWAKYTVAGMPVRVSWLTRHKAGAQQVRARNAGGSMLSRFVRGRVHVGPLDDARSNDTKNASQIASKFP